MYLGKLPIIGHLGRDPEMRFTPSGKPVTSFNVAVNHQYTGSDGEVVKETYWFRCSAWNKTAEACNQYLKKGSKVYIEGLLTADPTTGGPQIWTAQDGTPRASFELTVKAIKFLDSRPANGAPAIADQVPAGAGDPDSDIPF
jgi:single-strand DNA-binding protein